MEREVTELSGGELQRVAIAACLSREADLYLLDEPSAYLDVEDRLFCCPYNSTHNRKQKSNRPSRRTRRSSTRLHRRPTHDFRRRTREFEDLPIPQPTYETE